jgi:LPS O-antigen subunit length determinant protein (WzzB/FepE family)
MDQPAQDRSSSDDEINLHDLWKVLAKRKKLIIGLFLISVIAAAVISLLTPKVYRGVSVLQIYAKDFTAIYDEDSAEEDILGAEDVVVGIGQFDREKIKAFCPENASSIIDIELEALKQSQDKMQITVDAKNRESIPQIMEEFISCINKQPFIQRVTEQIRANLMNRKQELSALVEEGELMKRRFEKLLREGKMTILAFNPLEVRTMISEQKMELFTIEQYLKNPVGLVQMGGIFVPEKPVKPRIKLNIALAGILSIFAGVFLAFFLEFLSKAKSKNSTSG